MKNLLVIVSSALIAVALTQIAMASAEDEIAERLEKVGSVCVEGEDCATATAGTEVADSGGGTDAEQVYNQTCSTCHAMGIANAPKFGDAGAWAPRIEKGMETLYDHAINGLPPGMPAKGMCFSCSDEDLKAVVDYMVNAAQ